ncbi:hypothetical protein TNCV_3474651 [Trichonephila clavipes]|nr:hypothetical protein TNCV_3474651 [Trichonephila clavipes]
MVTLLKARLVHYGVELLQLHCIIHQENLYGKELGFATLMHCVSEAINFIRSNALKHRQFKEFLKDFDDMPSDILYYTEESEEKMTSHLHDNQAHLSTGYRISTEREEKE